MEVPILDTNLGVRTVYKRLLLEEEDDDDDDDV
jgi:hypothetical protein